MAASYFGENFGQGPSTLAIPPPPLGDRHLATVPPPPPHTGDRRALTGEIARGARGKWALGLQVHMLQTP